MSIEDYPLDHTTYIISPGDTLRLKKPWDIATEKTSQGTGEDRMNIWSLLIKLGPRCELKVLQSTKDVITCRAIEIQNEMLRAYITVDLDPKKMEWDQIEIVKGAEA